MRAEGTDRATRGPIVARAVHLLLIAAAAVGLRAWRLDRWSLWYDEVVTMRLALAPGPASLVDLLGEIDATRAPLHPLLLMGWLEIFGASELVARALSALLGVLTVVAVYATGWRAYGEPAGRWAALLCAVCPTLVVYSQEVRMYALLVFLTVLSWWSFLGFRGRGGWGSALCYAGLLASLVYCHPLGLFMVAAHGAAYAMVGRRLTIRPGRYLVALLTAALAVSPWGGRYFDHPPEYLLPRYPIRFLLGLPIEYIGGNSLTLLPLAALIAVGLLTLREGRPALREPIEGPMIVCWFAVPPVLLYAYSFVGHPIFGPSRYNLFVAPAYLLLVARGLVVLPAPARLAAAGVMLALAIQGVVGIAEPRAGKADWRGFARWLEGARPPAAAVVVHPHDPLFPRTHFEAARYYLEPRFEVFLEQEPTTAGSIPGGVVYHTHCTDDPAWVPGEGQEVVARFYRLTITLAARAGRSAAPRADPVRGRSSD